MNSRDLPMAAALSVLLLAVTGAVDRRIPQGGRHGRYEHVLRREL